MARDALAITTMDPTRTRRARALKLTIERYVITSSIPLIRAKTIESGNLARLPRRRENRPRYFACAHIRIPKGASSKISYSRKRFGLHRGKLAFLKKNCSIFGKECSILKRKNKTSKFFFRALMSYTWEPSFFLGTNVFTGYNV